jgi:hypothetical protein
VKASVEGSHSSSDHRNASEPFASTSIRKDRSNSFRKLILRNFWASEHFDQYDPAANGDALAFALQEHDRRSLGWFDNRIAVELRLWEAIDQGSLVPFQYFGVADGTDLRQLTWRRGGYAPRGSEQFVHRR